MDGNQRNRLAVAALEQPYGHLHQSVRSGAPPSFLMYATVTALSHINRTTQDLRRGRKSLTAQMTACISRTFMWHDLWDAVCWRMSQTSRPVARPTWQTQVVDSPWPSYPLVNSNWSYSPETPNLGQIRRFLEPCDLEIWRMTFKNNRAPLLCYFKLCAAFHSHWWIQTGVTVRKRPIWVKFCDFSAVRPWNLTDDLEKQ